MKFSRASTFVLLAAVLAVVIVFYIRTLRDDEVTLSNTSGQDNGILVNAQGSTGVLSDQAFQSLTKTIDVGRLTSAPGRNEVIAFTKSRPVAIAQNVQWTSGFDAVPVEFAAEIQISITVWIIDTPFASRRKAAASHCLTAVAKWTAERMGVEFAPGGCDIKDATSVADVDQFRGPMARSFDCVDDQQSLQQAISPSPGRINIYVVHSVDSGSGTGPGMGTSCGTSDFVALGSNALAGTFIHELGHTFSLEHIDAMTGFDATNFMKSLSGTRKYFTEGQIFRAHFTPAVPNRHPPGSALNIVYNARPLQPTRDCATDPCPALQKRIWADGAFPPN